MLVGNVFQEVFCVNIPCVLHAFKEICVSYPLYHSKSDNTRTLQSVLFSFSGGNHVHGVVSGFT